MGGNGRGGEGRDGGTGRWVGRQAGGHELIHVTAHGSAPISISNHATALASSVMVKRLHPLRFSNRPGACTSR